ncbi:MAG: hypothetical protein ACI9W4_000304 [Rhodothermales bacterium]|jgi:hypothetical protein
MSDTARDSAIWMFTETDYSETKASPVKKRYVPTLRSCPFCGSKETRVVESSFKIGREKSWLFRVGCGRCGAHCSYLDFQDTIAAWNRTRRIKGLLGRTTIARLGTEGWREIRQVKKCPLCASHLPVHVERDRRSEGDETKLVGPWKTRCQGVDCWLHGPVLSAENREHSEADTPESALALWDHRIRHRVGWTRPRLSRRTSVSSS